MSGNERNNEYTMGNNEYITAICRVVQCLLPELLRFLRIIRGTMDISWGTMNKSSRYVA